MHTSSVARIVTAALTLGGCFEATPEVEPAPRRAVSKKASSGPSGTPAKRIRVREWQFGRIDRSTPFDLGVIDERFPHRAVRSVGEPELDGATIQLLDGDEVLAHVFPSEAGDFVGRVWSTHDRARGPGNAHPGQPLRRLKAWPRLACARAPEPLEDHTRCAKPGGRVGYLVEDTGVTVPKQLGDAEIVGILWTAD